MDRLPEFVEAKLADLVELRDACRAIAQAAMNRADMDRRRIGDLKTNLQSARGSAPAMAMVGPRHGPSEEQVEEVRRSVELLEKRVAASIDEFSRKRIFADAADNSINHCRDFIARLPETVVLEPVAPVRLTNHDHTKLLALVRKEIGEVLARLAQVRSSPPPRAELEERVAAWVRAKAAGQRVQIRAQRPRTRPLEVTWHGAILSVTGPTGGGPPDPLTLQCRLHPEQVQALLMAEAERLYAGNEGLSDAEHDDEVARLTAKFHELGYSEEALVSEMLKVSPTACTRRHDALPEHILGCRVGKAARAAVAA